MGRALGTAQHRHSRRSSTPADPGASVIEVRHTDGRPDLVNMGRSPHPSRLADHLRLAAVLGGTAAVTLAFLGAGGHFLNQASMEFADEPVERGLPKSKKRKIGSMVRWLWNRRRPVRTAISWPTVILPTASGPTMYNRVGAP
jgi:hypothetical protein